MNIDAIAEKYANQLQLEAYHATPKDCISLAIKEANTPLLDTLEDLARQHCFTKKVDRDYNGQVAGTLVTDSGALSADADALRLLAERGRFRIIAEYNRMVVGYWPENDPQKKENT